MAEIRAFVGHSFLDKDADVVRRFLKYFDQLAKSPMSPRFSWQNAEPAEPKALEQKVLALLEGKNLFIGICTRREMVVTAESLQKNWFDPQSFKVRQSRLEWKTSDWVIQEIGLAKGRGLNLLLLVENGVRRPGGLQGDLEYISFDRQRPDEAFGKILEMVTALAPTATAVATTVEGPPTTPTSEVTPAATPNAIVPEKDWKKRDFEFALLQMIALDNDQGADEIRNAYFATPMGGESNDRISFDALREYLRIRFGKGGNLQNLKAMALANAQNAEIRSYLARALEHYGEYREAAATLETASQISTDSAEKLRLTLQAAVTFAKAKEFARMTALLSAAKANVETAPENEIELLETLDKLSEMAKHQLAGLSLKERLIELRPEDSNTRFSLAYKHGEAGNNEIEILHYLNIPEGERHGAAWNNLGVAFGNAKLPAKSVEALHKGIEMKETLAMSNLAERFIRAGFLSEAQSQCNAALEVPDYHQNVPTTVARLKSIPEEEEQKLQDLLALGPPKSAFYRSIGKAMARIDLTTIAESWTGPDCELRIWIDNGSFHATGTYERDDRSLTAWGILSATTGKKISYTLAYTGTIHGRAIEGHVSRKRDDGASVRSILSSYSDEDQVLIFLNDDGSELHVMENPKGNNQKIYALKRKSL